MEKGPRREAKASPPSELLMSTLKSEMATHRAICKAGTASVRERKPCQAPRRAIVFKPHASAFPISSSSVPSATHAPRPIRRYLSDDARLRLRRRPSSALRSLNFVLSKTPFQRIVNFVPGRRTGPRCWIIRKPTIAFLNGEHIEKHKLVADHRLPRVSDGRW